MKHRFITVTELKKAFNVRVPKLKECELIGPPLRISLRLGFEYSMYSNPIFNHYSQ